MTNQVFQVLNISGQETTELKALSSSGSDQWLIQSPTKDGQNVHYQLCVIHPRGRASEVELPWVFEQTCSNCQGQGETYVWRQGQSSYEAAECPICQGHGTHSSESEFSLTISDGLGGRKVIRKNRGGRLNARMGLRGDLILNLSWVEELSRPEGLETPAAAN